MKKYIALACALIVLLLAACQTVQSGGETTEGTTAAQETTTLPEETTVPEYTTIPEETTMPEETAAPIFTAEGTPLDASELAAFQEMFDDVSSWYNRATRCTYSDVIFVDWYELFYDGIPGEGKTLTEEEKNFLSYTYIGGMVKEGLDCVRLRRSEMDKVLKEYFDISLEDTSGKGLYGLIYWDETDSYYKIASDSNAINVLLHSAYAQEDGTIDIYYCDGGWEENVTASPDFVITLAQKDGKYIVVSNLPV